MKQFDGLLFEEFKEADISIYTPIMKRAFDEDTQRHTDKSEGGPDGYDNGEFIKKWYINKNAKAFKVMKDGVPVGAINVFINKNNINFLGNMFVDPSCQDKGIGLKIWSFIESEFPETIKWCTETPAYSRRNHNFYVNKCGFHVVRIDNPKSDNGGSFILEKIMKRT